MHAIPILFHEESTMRSTTAFKSPVALFVALLTILSVTAIRVHGQSTDAVDVQKELAALRSEVAALRAQQNENWLNEARAAEVKKLIHEMLADADTRKSLTDDTMTAGYDKTFFLASADGNFRLNIQTHLQLRYIYGHDEGESTAPTDDDESGFQIRRARLFLFGHAVDPRFTYRFMAGFNRNGGAFELEDAYVQYAVTDDLSIRAGQFRAPFMREEIVGATSQVAVERSAVNEWFTVDFVQGVMAVWDLGDSVQVSGMVHDGRESYNKDYADDFTDYAVTGRIEWLLMGKWSQWSDMIAWSSDPVGLMLGAAIDYEETENGGSGQSPVDDFMTWTVDLSLEAQPFFASAAGVGRLVNDDDGIDSGTLSDPVSDDEFQQYGVTALVGVFLIPDKFNIFLRYEWLDTGGFKEVTDNTYDDLDSPASSQQTIWTLGTNYYFRKHNSKLTLDLLYAPNGIRKTESGLGLIQSDSDDASITARAQYQFLF
jgi:hypothetical protein